MSKQLNINPPMDKLARDNGLGHWSCVFPRAKSGWLRSDGEDATINISASITELTNEIVILSLKKFDSLSPIGKDWQKPEPYNIDVIRKSYGFTIDYDGQIFGLIAGDMGYEATGMFVDATTTKAILEATKPDISDWQQPTIQDQVNLDLYKHEKTVEDLIKLASNDPIIANLFNAYRAGCFSSQRAMLIELAFVLSSTLSDAREKLKTNSRLNRDFKPTIEPFIEQVINNQTLVQKPFQYPCDGALYFTKESHEQVYVECALIPKNSSMQDGIEKVLAISGIFASGIKLRANQNGINIEYEDGVYCFGNPNFDLIMFVWD